MLWVGPYYLIWKVKYRNISVKTIESDKLSDGISEYPADAVTFSRDIKMDWEITDWS